MKPTITEQGHEFNHASLLTIEEVDEVNLVYYGSLTGKASKTTTKTQPNIKTVLARISFFKSKIAEQGQPK